MKILDIDLFNKVKKDNLVFINLLDESKWVELKNKLREMDDDVGLKNTFEEVMELDDIPS